MLSRDRSGTKMRSSYPRPKCKGLIFKATKKRKKDGSNPSPATKADNSKGLSVFFIAKSLVNAGIVPVVQTTRLRAIDNPATGGLMHMFREGIPAAAFKPVSPCQQIACFR